MANNSGTLDQLVGPGFDRDAQKIIEIRGELRGLVGDFVAANDAAKKAEGFMGQAQSLKQVSDASKTLVDTNGQLISSYGKVTAKLAEAAAVKERYNGSTKDVLQTSEKLIRLNREEEKALEQAAKARRANSLAIDAENKARASNARATEAEMRAEQTRARIAAKGTADQVSQYDQLRKAYNDAAKAAKEIGVAEGINSARFKQSAAEAKKMYDVLYAVESAVGQNQRGVGQYERGAAGLSNAVQQILREAPSAAVSLNTFFLAISNNLPILFDEIGRVNVKLGELKAASEAANLQLATQTEIQKGAAQAAQAAEETLSAQVETIVANVGASQEQAAALRANVQQTVDNAAATGENTLAMVANTEQLAVNAGATVEEAAALRAQAEATALATQASIRQTAALEAQTLATAEANAVAAKAPSVLKGIVGSLLSYNTALTLLVLGLTLFGGKLADAAGSLFGITKASKEAEKAAKKYAEALKSIDDAATKSAASEVAHLNTLVTVATSINRTMADRKAAALDLQKTYPTRFANLTQEAILEGKVGDAVARTTKEIYARARASAAEKKFGESENEIYTLTLSLREVGKEYEKLKKIVDANPIKQGVGLSFTGLTDSARRSAANDLAETGKQYQAIAKRISELQAQQSQFRDDADKAAADGYSAGEAPEGTTAALRKKISDLKAVIELQKIGSAEQIASTKELIELEKQLKAVEGKGPKEKGSKPADRTNETLKAETDLTKELYNEYLVQANNAADAQKRIGDDEKQALADRLLAYDNYISDRIRAAYLESASEQQVIRQRLAKISEIEGKDSGKRTNEEKNLLLQKSILQQQLVNVEYATQGKVADAIGDGEQLQVAAQKKADEARIAQAKKTQKELDDLSEGFGTTGAYNRLESAGQTAQQNREKYAQQGVQFAQSLAAVQSGITQGRINEIDEEIKKINEKRDAELLAIEKSALSEQEKEERISAVKARAAAQEQELARQRVEQLRKAAIFEKGVTIAQILASTALATIKQAAATPLPAGALAIGTVIALGAAQLAAAIAAPLPAYAEGSGEDFVMGRAITDEKGPEGYVEKSGRVYIGSDKGPNVKNFTTPTKIIPHEELMRMSIMMTLRDYLPQDQAAQGIDVEGLKQEMTGVRKAIEGKRDTTVNITNLGIEHIARAGGSTTHYINGIAG